jgi:hypothetical protein
MIADKIIPCFYMVEVEGTAIKSIFVDDYGIARMTLASSDFRSDLHAATALDAVISTLCEQVDLADSRQDLDMNPEFFPSVGSPTLSPEQLQQIEEVAELAEETSRELAAQNKVAIVITKSFDAMGDYVVFRKTISSENFKIAGRVVSNLGYYSQLKSADQIKKISYEFENAITPQILFH